MPRREGRRPRARNPFGKSSVTVSAAFHETLVSLFHVKELRMGVFNHQPYNLGWGHHHCNVVVKDSGIFETLGWMKQVLQRNKFI